MLGALCAASAAELGMPAPSLSIDQWIKGNPIDLKQGKGSNVYVVEFWATWCPPCRDSVPHLSALQQKFRDKGVVIIGISDEAPGKVRSFVKRMGDKMNYSVAVDKNQGTSKNYMNAFGIETIPHAFIVDKHGRMVWHGHPMDQLDTALNEVITETFDLAAAQTAEKLRSMVSQYFAMVTNAPVDPKAKELGAEIFVKADTHYGILGEFAWRILTDRLVKERDRNLALKAARRAYEGTHGRDAGMVDTYARALFDNGHHEEAIKYQQEAIAACKDSKVRFEMEATLNRYKRLSKEKR